MQKVAVTRWWIPATIIAVLSLGALAGSLAYAVINGSNGRQELCTALNQKFTPFYLQAKDSLAVYEALDKGQPIPKVKQPPAGIEYFAKHPAEVDRALPLARTNARTLAPEDCNAVR